MATSSASPSGKHVVIVGAGAGGTALAARLAHAGHRVSVVEKHADVGGRCSLLQRAGHRWDVGPSLYLMPEIFDAAFASLGRRREDMYELHLAAPAYKIHYHDGRSLHLSSDLVAMGKMLEEFERPAGSKDPLGSFMAFIKEAGEHYEESIKHVLTLDWTHLLGALSRWDLYPMLLRTKVLHIWTTLYARASHHFKSDHIRRAMTFSSMYMGMSPFDAPATYSLLQYAEYAKGVWYPIGGFQRVVAAFHRVAEEHGATFRFNTGVRKILLGPKGARGVELESGEEIEADVVVSNVDLVHTYNSLLPPDSYAKRLQNKDQTCSSISFYWGMKEIVPELGGHNIFLAEAYRESFDEIFRDGLLPTEPSFYVNVPSRLDPTAAPPGKDTLVVLVPCGPIPLPGSDAGGRPQTREAFAATKARARKQIIETLKKRLGRDDFESLIDVEEVLDPFDWRERFSLFRGSILGLSHTIPQVLWFRPSVQHATHKNLFFCGASTQPGTGVPVVVAGSGVVAARVDAFLRGKAMPGRMPQVSLLLAALLLPLLLLFLRQSV